MIEDKDVIEEEEEVEEVIEDIQEEQEEKQGKKKRKKKEGLSQKEKRRTTTKNIRNKKYVSNKWGHTEYSFGGMYCNDNLFIVWLYFILLPH